jgi:hypothetical protein
MADSDDGARLVSEPELAAAEAEAAVLRIALAVGGPRHRRPAAPGVQGAAAG